MNWRPHVLLDCLLLAAGLALLAGCDRGPKRYHLSGQVLYDGKPVPAGEIFFDPDGKKKHDGPQGFARIKDGRYDTRDGGKPAGSGPYVARILGGDGVIPPGADLPLGRPLFPEYTKSVDIPAEEDAKLNFDVPVKRPP